MKNILRFIENKTCPCCGAPQTFFSLKGQRRELPCKSKQNYVCLSCNTCHNQIGTPIPVWLAHVSAIAMLVLSWIIARSLRNQLGLWDTYQGIFFDAPMMLVVYLFISYIVWFFTPLSCIKVGEKAKHVDADPLQIEKMPMLTSIEKKVLMFNINIVFLLQVFLVCLAILGAIYIWIK